MLTLKTHIRLLRSTTYASLMAVLVLIFLGKPSQALFQSQVAQLLLTVGRGTTQSTMIVTILVFPPSGDAVNVHFSE